MTETTLDQRFSVPGAKAADWAETAKILGDAQLSWICTVRADGRPHLTPLVAVWLDEALLTRLAQAWARKWDGQWQFQVRDGRFEHQGGSVPVFAVHPAEVLAFAKGEQSAQTRHRL